MNSDNVKEFCDLTGQFFDRIVDKWIFITPKSPHIIECYEVYQDISAHFQLLELYSDSQNVYQYLKSFGENGVKSGIVTSEMIQFVFQFILQISHAFAIAHHNKLTHGGFNLSQVLLKSFVDVPFLKLTSFRPWLVGSNNPVKNLEIGRLLSDKDIFKITCYKDL